MSRTVDPSTGVPGRIPSRGGEPEDLSEEELRERGALFSTTRGSDYRGGEAFDMQTAKALGQVPPVGTWRMDPVLGFLEQLQRVPVDELTFSESTTDPIIRHSVDKYVGYYQAGLQPPPAEVVWNEPTQRLVTVNRRRVLAAKEAGVPSILAWVGGDTYENMKARTGHGTARRNPRRSRRPLDRDLYDSVVAEAKRKFDVWPSAYASGWVVKTYKARGGRYAGGDKKTRTGLTKWFGESWVDLSRPIHDEDGQLVGYEPCGRKASDDPAAYPKCRPLAEALRMSPSEVKDAIKRKRAAEAKAGRGGAHGRGGRGARAPVRVPTYRANPMREPGDVPGFRIAVLEHQKPGAFKGRIILAAYTDDGQMLAWLGALPATLRSSMSTSSGARAAAFPELDVSPYSPPSGDTTVWEVAKAHAWVNGWGPLLYEALLAFVASKGYSGWVTSDSGTTSNEARAVWRRFSERDDVEFREDVGRNVSGEPIHAMRALPALLAKRAPLLKKLDRRAAYTRAAKQFLRGDANQGSGRFAVAEDEARANPYDPEDDPLSDVYVIATDEFEDGTVVKYVASPFPYERKPLGHNDDPKVQGLVNLATLIGTQRRVSVAGVEKYLGDAERPPRPGSARMPPITVYETSDGRQYIADGHHRAVAALIRGLETFPAIIQLVRE